MGHWFWDTRASPPRGSRVCVFVPMSVFAFCHCICTYICAMSVSVRVSIVTTELRSPNLEFVRYVCHLNCPVGPLILVLHFSFFCLVFVVVGAQLQF